MIRVLYKHGGGSGIRTHGSLRIPGFQDRCFKPLSHPSSLRIPRLDSMILSQHSSLCACRQTFSKICEIAARRTEHWDYFRIRGNRDYHYYLDGLKVNGKRKRLFSTISSVPRSATNQALSG
jgi:hypothetical protein